MKSTDMAKFRVLTDSELYEGLMQQDRDNKVTRLHKEIQILINGPQGDKVGDGEQDSKLILQGLNCSELKLSSLSINSSMNKLVASQGGNTNKRNDEN